MVGVGNTGILTHHDAPETFLPHPLVHGTEIFESETMAAAAAAEQQKQNNVS